MFWSILIAVYIVRLITTYFVLRSVYLDRPRIIGLDDVILCTIPFLGLIGVCHYLNYLPRPGCERRILNKIFKVK